MRQGTKNACKTLYTISNPGFCMQVKRCLYFSLVWSHSVYASRVWSPFYISIYKWLKEFKDVPFSPLVNHITLLQLLPISYLHELKDRFFSIKPVNRIFWPTRMQNWLIAASKLHYHRGICCTKGV